MPYKVRYDDITTLEVDAIVNSLGINGSVYGRLCKNILKVANSLELTNFINQKVHNDVGDMFVTSGYNLPAKNIIHVVSPFKNEDSNNKKLYSIYTNVVKTAINRGFKRIAIPFLGTGANGYSDKDAFDALTEVCADLMEKEDEKNEDILDIIIVIKGSNSILQSQHKQQELYETNFDREMLFRNHFSCGTTVEKKEGKDDENNKLYKNFVKCIKLTNSINPKDLFVPLTAPYKYPYDFVDDYVCANNIDDRILNKKGLDRRIKHRFRTKGFISKMDVFKIALTLKMNTATTIQFMMLCGYSFDPREQADMIYVKYLSGEYPGVQDIHDLTHISGYYFEWN